MSSDITKRTENYFEFRQREEPDATAPPDLYFMVLKRLRGVPVDPETKKVIAKTFMLNLEILSRITRTPKEPSVLLNHIKAKMSDTGLSRDTILKACVLTDEELSLLESGGFDFVLSSFLVSCIKAVNELAVSRTIERTYNDEIERVNVTTVSLGNPALLMEDDTERSKVIKSAYQGPTNNPKGI